MYIIYNMNTTFHTTTIEDFLDQFAGRIGMQNYDNTKPIKISECNRDFVWKPDMQQAFICSIIMGFPIPAICITNGQIVDGGNRSTTLWLFRNGAFKIKIHADSEPIDYTAMCLDRSLTRKWDSAIIPHQNITNASPDQFAQIYENLNKGIQLTFGQLLENRKYCPWVAMAESLIGRGNTSYPDVDLLHQVWTNGFKKTKHRRELGFAFQVLVGAEKGPTHFHLCFSEHIPLIMGDTIPTSGRLRMILLMMASCNLDYSVSSKKKKEVFQKFIGAIIHDMHTMTITEWKEKWTLFIKQAYNSLSEKMIKRILNVGNLRATSSTRIAGVSDNVRRFLQSNGLEESFSGEDSDKISNKIKPPEIEEESRTIVKVKRVTINGQLYLKSSANVLYDVENREEIGVYDEATNTINPMPECSDNELSDEEYDDDDDDESA